MSSMVPLDGDGDGLMRMGYQPAGQVLVAIFGNSPTQPPPISPPLLKPHFGNPLSPLYSSTSIENVGI
ncbi:hypothetical protein PHYBLDRAFT_144389 [Phycomyces blakesleeanus NRRL 1555(-)]|uniref:Uncharacterized protein n=1 Tax=Phycomyces blakesleeanus (strain ATCC 8743b / DSM 1359 / FGSC 10004 / NBRC 33097 / NRRL 1555) TaxID=763407 RepID=A0A162PX87_PHYB8|nr:hypothetical protein PHYBLDRAFT_144389 [Phycomyces blakesleeanus NRRL 1555(-)]OAD75036.1 hypothetical protein PHYBLDRAFT_144389 [Phycomyces blakesleeanus NRRL 1555(-)]|eukprot:XP_018293076.1 hypothetical protein PHYBLDRAFT_144389 [Phycomyces blakesleeanus NRRL 1555(-)]